MTDPLDLTTVQELTDEALEAATRALFDALEARRGMPAVGDTSWAGIRGNAQGAKAKALAELTLRAALPHLLREAREQLATAEAHGRHQARLKQIALAKAETARRDALIEAADDIDLMWADVSDEVNKIQAAATIEAEDWLRARAGQQ